MQKHNAKLTLLILRAVALNFLFAAPAWSNAPIYEEPELPPLHKAASEGNAEKLSVLLSGRADANAKDVDGTSPLHHVKNREAVALLIINGADVNARDDLGNTPLHSARDGKITALLIAKGAKVKVVNKKGESPLHWGLASREKMKVLLHNKADINAKDDEGLTPLHEAAGEDDAADKMELSPHWRSKDVVAFLLAHGADILARDNSGWTPLHWAAFKGQKDVVIFLLKKGAKVNALLKDSIPLYM